jgi:hypothetical protein
MKLIRVKLSDAAPDDESPTKEELAAKLEKSAKDFGDVSVFSSLYPDGGKDGAFLMQIGLKNQPAIRGIDLADARRLIKDLQRALEYGEGLAAESLQIMKQVKEMETGRI